jgi:Protein of unknown function (DUF2946)
MTLGDKPGFLDQLRQCRRPLIAVVVMLVLLQALVSGLANARAATMSASSFDAVICHGGGGGTELLADDSPGSSRDSGAAKDLCCAFCAAAAPAVLTVTAPVIGHVGWTATDSLTRSARAHVVIAARAVRAGLSQAPPRFA